MPRAWRIVKERFARQAFDGDGARLHGGRWTSPGVPMIYLAESRALALLEILVHVADEQLMAHYVLFEVVYEARDCIDVTAARLPANWAKTTTPAKLREVGDRWFARRESLLLSVPSAVVREERNLLLNPLHKRFSAVRIGRPERIPVDQRLRRGRHA